MNDQEKIDKFTHSYINDDFGLTIDQLVPKVKGYGRFNVWLSGNESKIRQVLKAVKEIGVSPTLFAVYEKNEGYSAGLGWLNHTSARGDYLTDAKFIARKLVSQSKQAGQPSWYDYGNPVHFVPQDVQRKGNADFAKNMKSGTIGRAYIPLTAAATWAAYYPPGLKVSYNKVQNYGNPFLDGANAILAWGGKLDGKGGSPSDSSDSGSSGDSGSSLLALAKQAMQELLKKVQDALQWDVHSIGSDKFFSNDYFTLQKTFNNTYHIKMTIGLLDSLKKLIDSVQVDSGGSSSNPTDDDGDHKPISGKSVKPNGKSGRVIGGNWTYAQLPEKYKKAIGVPLFKKEYLYKPGNIFPQTGNAGQCTELTWAYMSQLHGKRQPTDDGQITNGQRVWYVYKKLGAKTTHNPTVGYGFSSKPPYLQASIYGIGHTGVVVAVFDDGSFLVANYNVPPYVAPSRVVLYTLINGVPHNAGDNIVFFSGIA